MTTKKKKGCWERWNEEWLCKMKPKEPSVEKDKGLIENVQLYHNSMAVQESLLQWYRASFIALEAALFTFAYFIRTFDLCLIGIPASVGIIGCFIWWAVCTQRTNLIDKQRCEIERLVQDTNLETWYDIYLYTDRFRRKIAQHVFNVGLPIIVGLLWVLLLIQSCTCN
jgi:hypothetical protein